MRKRLPELILVFVLLSSFSLKLNHLGHYRFGTIDECCHALVAKNLLKHPFKPTLIDEPYIFYGETEWGSNHVWLHKPILPLWQGALSFFFFGVSTFAFRLPSALLSTLAVLLTYLIGVQLFSRHAALIASFAQAFSYFIMNLVQGYQFSDAVDISLLFYCELGMYGVIRLVKTGKWRFVWLSGIGQGLAFLSKTYPAFIITGVALAALLSPRLLLAKKEDCRLHWFHLLAILGITGVVAGAWMLYTAIQFPIEFKIEHDYIFRHLTENIEFWGAPWHRVLNYTDRIFDCFFIPVAVAVCGGVTRLFREKHMGRTLLYAWGIGVMVPFLFATTKTPSATLIKVPAFYMIFGDFVVRTVQRKVKDTRMHRWFRKGWMVTLCFFSLMTIYMAYDSTAINSDTKTLLETATFAEKHLPPNAVLLVEINGKNPAYHCDAHYLMFLTPFTAHTYHSEHAYKAMSRQVKKNGGIPYVVTESELPLPILFKSEKDKRTLYALPDMPIGPDENKK